MQCEPFTSEEILIAKLRNDYIGVLLDMRPISFTALSMFPTLTWEVFPNISHPDSISVLRLNHTKTYEVCIRLANGLELYNGELNFDLKDNKTIPVEIDLETFIEYATIANTYIWIKSIKPKSCSTT